MAYIEPFGINLRHILPNVASPCSCQTKPMQVAHSERVNEIEIIWSLSWAMKSSLTAQEEKPA